MSELDFQKTINNTHVEMVARTSFAERRTSAITAANDTVLTLGLRSSQAFTLRLLFARYIIIFMFNYT